MVGFRGLCLYRFWGEQGRLEHQHELGSRGSGLHIEPNSKPHNIQIMLNDRSKLVLD